MDVSTAMLRRRVTVLAVLPLALVVVSSSMEGVASPATENPHACPGSVTGSGSAQNAGLMDGAIAWWRGLAARFNKPAAHKADDTVVCEVMADGKTRCISVAERCPSAGSLPGAGSEGRM